MSHSLKYKPCFSLPSATLEIKNVTANDDRPFIRLQSILQFISTVTTFFHEYVHA